LELVEKEIENWIKPFATLIGGQEHFDSEAFNQNPVKHFLRTTLPDNFQDYAIAFHSFWVNHNIPQDRISEMRYSSEKINEEGYTRVNWKAFYLSKKVPFELKKAIINSVTWKFPFEQMSNELFPGEGLIDKEHLESFVEIVLDFYGNQEIEVFYIFLSTMDWEQDLMFKGSIEELPNLFKHKNLRLTPSLIYPKERNWAVKTDYDLAFSTMGGESKFINELVFQNQNEIVKVED